MKRNRHKSPWLSAAVLLSFLAGLLPTTPAAAQAASLSLHPDSGDPPAVRGALSGSGWCYPASSVIVSGRGVTGSANIAADGGLTGSFSVTGSAGDVVTIEVSATCREGGSGAEAPFTFNAPPTPAPTPRPVITRTPTLPPPVAPTFTVGPSSAPSATPAAAALPAVSNQGTVAILGCEPAAAEVSIAFTVVGPLGTQPGSAAFLAPALATSDPHLFLFDGPTAPPGTIFDVRVEVDSSDCPSDWNVPPEAWVSGDSVHLVVVPPDSSQLFLSSLGNEAPTKKNTEFGIKGEWVLYIETAGSAAGHSHVFGWNTRLSNASGGELQASVLPFPKDPASSLTTPPGVVKTWDVDCVNCSFSVDLSPLYPMNLLTEGSSAQSAWAKLSLAVKQGWNTVSQSVQSLVNSLTGGGGAVAVAQAQPSLPSGESPSDYMTAGHGAPLMITEYYFRVVPRAGGQVVGAATNTVRIKFFADLDPGDVTIEDCGKNPKPPGCPTAVPAGPKPYIVDIVAYHGVIPASPGHEDCYLATKETTLSHQIVVNNNWTTWMETIPKGEQFCPPKPASKGPLDWLVDLVVNGLNFISQAYEDLKAEVVSVVASFVPGDLCGKKCLGTILDGVLATLGIPPSIPNFDKLMEQGIDYVAAQAAEQLPIPPGLSAVAQEEFRKQAEAKFKAGLQAGIEAAKVALSESVSYVPDGVPVVPDPKGSVQPATLFLRITRDPKVPEAAGTCSMSSQAAAANLVISSTVSQSVITSKMQAFNDTHHGPGPGQGPDLTIYKSEYLYETEALPLPFLSPGESMSVPILLVPVFTWGKTHGFVSPYDQAEAWRAMYHGGQATLMVSDSPCVTGDSLIVQADGSWSDPSIINSFFEGLGEPVGK